MLLNLLWQTACADTFSGFRLCFLGFLGQGSGSVDSTCFGVVLCILGGCFDFMRLGRVVAGLKVECCRFVASLETSGIRVGSVNRGA